MVNVVAMTMGTSSKEVPILRFEVWWMTSLGLMDGSSRELAIERLKASDLEPAPNMVPVPVAIGFNGSNEVYEIIGR